MDLLGSLIVLRLGVGISRRRDGTGEGRHIIRPGPVYRALDRVLRMQTRRDRLVQVLVDSVGFEQRYLVVDPQYRHFLVRRDGEEPVRPVVGLDVAELELGVLLAQDNGGALHPGTSLEADQHIFCHGDPQFDYRDPRMMARSASVVKHKTRRLRPGAGEGRVGQARYCAAWRWASRSSSCLTGCRSRPSGLAVTRTESPSRISPERIFSASGFCSSRCITRFRGRAPYTGS